MQPGAHVAVSSAMSGAIYWATGSVPMAVSCLASGVLIDLDHVLDFCLISGEKFTPGRFMRWCNDMEWDRIYLFLHSVELFLLYALFVHFNRTDIAVGVLLGAGVHLALDQIFNREVRPEYYLSSYFYFLIFRVRCGFLRTGLCPRIAKPIRGRE